MIRMHGQGAVDINHNKGRYRPDNDGFISVPPELVSALEKLGFTRVPDPQIPAEVQTTAPEVSRDAPTGAELLDEYEAEVLAAGYAPAAAKSIAAARLKSLRENIPYEEALRLIDLVEAARPPVLIPDIPVDGAGAAPIVPETGDLVADAASIVPEMAPIVPDSAAIVPSDDPAELERQALYNELVAGGNDPAEARALVWDIPDQK